ncbi:MAG: response regulator [Thermodesulfobacteriota bacterium]|nr:response regulator [Thermodesulfobacteriota bacterium]
MAHKKTILIVDDEERNIKLLKAMLTSEGHSIYSALNGKDALKMAVDICPDIILLDVMMPGLDGFEVCKRIKQNKTTRSIPVLMVTALNTKDNHIKGIEAGADDFLTKPVDRAELRIRVKSLLRIKSFHDELLSQYNEITEKNQRLSRLEKIKDRLMHMIVHDINNPLQAIFMSLQMILVSQENLSENQIKRLKECLNRCADLEELTKSILDINKMEEGKLALAKEFTNLLKLAKDTLVQFEERINARELSLSFLSREDILPVSIDPGLIKRVIANLIDNAIRHTPQRGEVEVSIDRQHKERKICFSIKDNGDGIAPKYQQKIFDKFQQAEMKQAGVITGKSGLGLTFCKMAIEAHDGEIWVKSEGKGKGSTFGFTIPCTPVVV